MLLWLNADGEHDHDGEDDHDDEEAKNRGDAIVGSGLKFSPFVWGKEI